MTYYFHDFLFSKLLDSSSDRIEVSNNVCGVHTVTVSLTVFVIFCAVNSWTLPVMVLRCCTMHVVYTHLLYYCFHDFLCSKLLDSTSDGIEVSYNACGVLSHMVSDGAAAWTITEPTRERVLRNMEEAISRWQLKTKRNINYRYFSHTQVIVLHMLQ